MRHIGKVVLLGQGWQQQQQQQRQEKENQERCIIAILTATVICPVGRLSFWGYPFGKISAIFSVPSRRARAHTSGRVDHKEWKQVSDKKEEKISEKRVLEIRMNQESCI